MDIDIKKSSCAEGYLESVKDLSDRHKKFLGMLPYEAIESSYSRGEILLALVDGKFAGYLLYRFVTTYRRLSITHLCVASKYRNMGITELLIDELKCLCKSSNYNGVILNCRRDYDHANRVWQRNLLVPIDEKLSRSNSSDQLVASWWWVNSECEDLFPSTDNPEAIYAVLDVNVIIDLKNNDESVMHLLNDSLIEDLEFCVCKETWNEIYRHKESRVRGETREYVNKFQSLDFTDSVFERYEVELNELLPNNDDQQISDIRQLAQTIAAGKNVFITKDQLLLSMGPELYKRFDLSLIQPNTIWKYLDERVHSESYQPVRLSGSTINLGKMRAHEVQNVARKFLGANESLSNLVVKLNQIVDDLENAELLIVRKNEEMLAVFAVNDVAADESIVPIFRVLDSRIAYTLSIQIITYILKRQAKAKKSKLLLAEAPSISIENLDKVFGFRKVDDYYFKKMMFEISDEKCLHNSLNKSVSSTKLPDFRLVDLYGNLKDSSLDLEKALWPLKATDIDVPIYVIPIRSQWAMQMFDEEIASEDIFGSDPALAFNFENIYYSATNQSLSWPGRIVWYVSSNMSKSPLSGHIRAISYLDKVDSGNAQTLYRRYKRLGIYSWDDVFEAAGSDLNKDIKAILFSRTELLNAPITLEDFSSMRESLGNAKPNLMRPLSVDIETFKCVSERLY